MIVSTVRSLHATYANTEFVACQNFWYTNEFAWRNVFCDLRDGHATCNKRLDCYQEQSPLCEIRDYFVIYVQIVTRPIGRAAGLRLSLLRNLFSELDLVGAHLRQRENLLNIYENAIHQPIRPKPNTSYIEIVISGQPHNG